MERVPHSRRVLRVGQVRTANRAAVLRLLRRHRQLSRAELARRTSLSEASVSRIIAELMDQGLLVDLGNGPGTGGRPGARLELNEDRFQAIGVDIQNWETQVALGTATGKILRTERFRTPQSPAETLDRIAASVAGITGSLAEPPVGIGVSTRGLVDSRHGVAELGSNPAWVHVEIGAYLTGLTNLPVYVENNVRAAAVAEYVNGNTDVQGAHCLLFVLVGEGVGMAIVLDGKVHHGPNMAAGEIGQMVIADQGGPERHNRSGCLEVLASDLATCDRYNNLAGTKARSSNSSSCTQQMRQICQLAMEGDPHARAAVTATARFLGIGIANAVWALDADAVVIDGPVTEAWPLVSAAIRDQFPEGPLFLNFRNLVLRPSALGGEAAVIGAITLPFAPIFSFDGTFA
jgi:predicted NBD/HSP70 family sugar kinase/biotin operon repressor